ncbi:MAG: PAS domain S-box protein [Nitrospirae bacterium]|nr:PAS domain S-box protein [Nitrospirota bacterium]
MNNEQDTVISRNILENMTDGVMTIDLTGQIITFNAPAAGILGMNKADVLGKKFAEVFFEREGNDDFNQAILDAIYDASVVHNRTVTFNTGGKTIALSLRTSFLHSEAEGGLKKVGVIAVFTDISELKDLRDAEVRLTDELKSKHRELQDAYLKTEEANAGLEAALRKVQVIRTAATVFSIILFVGIGLFTWNRKLGPEKAGGPGPGASAQAPATFTVNARQFSSALQVTGALDPIHIINVTSPILGKVREVRFHYGDIVKEGQALVIMDTSEAEVKLSEAKASYIKAVEKVRELDDWESSPEVARARRSLSKAKLSLENQKKNLEETERLFKKGIVPATEYEGVRQQYLGQQLDYQSAEEELKSALGKAAPEHKNIAALEMKIAQSRLRELESQISQAVVKAPVSGVVIMPAGGQDGKEGRRVENGISYQQGELLVTIGDLSGFSVRSKVDEIDVVKIKDGQKVRVTGNAFSDVTLNGAVRAVSSQASRAQGGGGGAPSFDLVIAVDNITPEQRKMIFVGMSANLEIVIYEKADAIMVPVSAVKTDSGKRYVVRKDGQRQEVETGTTNLDSVEILKGLKAGEEILL